MGGEPDQHLRADDLANLLRRQVVLAEMDAVGAGLDGGPRSVVDDQHRSDPLAQGPRRVGDGRQLFVSKTLLAQLNDRDAPRHGRAQQVRERPGVGWFARKPADEIQPGRPNTRAALITRFICGAGRHRSQSRRSALVARRT